MKEWAALQAAVQKQRRRFDDGLRHVPEKLQGIAHAVLEAFDATTVPKRDVALHGAMLRVVSWGPLPNSKREPAMICPLNGSTGV